MRQAARLLIASLIATLPGLITSAAFAADEAAAAWQAAQRAQAAHEALSDRYLAIWPTLDANQRARFAAQERAWLNEGRQREQRACVARAGSPTDLIARTCEADAIERHLGSLVAPQRTAVSG